MFVRFLRNARGSVWKNASYLFDCLYEVFTVPVSYIQADKLNIGYHSYHLTKTLHIFCGGACAHCHVLNNKGFNHTWIKSWITAHWYTYTFNLLQAEGCNSHVDNYTWRTSKTPVGEPHVENNTCIVELHAWKTSTILHMFFRPLEGDILWKKRCTDLHQNLWDFVSFKIMLNWKWLATLKTSKISVKLRPRAILITLHVQNSYFKRILDYYSIRRVRVCTKILARQVSPRSYETRFLRDFCNFWTRELHLNSSYGLGILNNL